MRASDDFQELVESDAARVALLGSGSAAWQAPTTLDEIHFEIEITEPDLVFQIYDFSFAIQGVSFVSVKLGDARSGWVGIILHIRKQLR